MWSRWHITVHEVAIFHKTVLKYRSLREVWQTFRSDLSLLVVLRGIMTKRMLLVSFYVSLYLLILTFCIDFCLKFSLNIFPQSETCFEFDEYITLVRLLAAVKLIKYHNLSGLD